MPSAFDLAPRPLRGRATKLILAIVIVAVSAALAVLVHLFLGLLTLRIAAAPGADGARAASALAQLFAADHPRVRVNLLPESNLTAVTDALTRGEAALAVVRSDAAGQDSQTLVILRRDAAVFAAPGHSAIDGVGKLRGRVVGLLSDQALDASLLDRVLRHYGVPPEAVRRVTLGVDGVLDAIRHRRVDALFVVSPVDGPIWLPLFAALRKGSEGTPTVFEIDEAAAMTKDGPGLETLDVPKGAFQGSLPAPGDDVTTLSVSYRLVARRTMPDWLAGEIAREVLTSKPRLAAMDPGLTGIEAPDTDDKTASLPIHSGAVAYLSGTLPSLSDQVQNVLYWLGLTASAAASVGAASVAVYRRVRPRRPPTRVMRLLEIWLTARSGRTGDLDSLEAEADGLVHETIQAEAHGRTEVAEMRLVALLAGQVRQTIDGRRRERP